jgi:hypothetical protein
VKTIACIAWCVLASGLVSAAQDVDPPQPVPLASVKVSLEALTKPPATRWIEWRRTGPETRGTFLPRGTWTLRSKVIGQLITLHLSGRNANTESLQTWRYIADQWPKPGSMRATAKGISAFAERTASPTYQFRMNDKESMARSDKIADGPKSTAWPTGTVTTTALMRGIEQLEPAPGRVYSFGDLHDPIRQTHTPGPLWLAYGGQKSRLSTEGGGKSHAWVVRKPDDPKPLLTFWTDDKQKLQTVTFDPDRFILRRQEALPIQSVQWTKLQNQEPQIAFAFTRQFTGSKLKMEGRWVTSHSNRNDLTHVTDRFETIFRGQKSHVEWESFYAPNQPLRPVRYSAQEGHEKHLHTTKVSMDNKEATLQSIGHKGETSSIKKAWPAAGVLRTGLGRVVRHLPTKTRYAAWKLDAIFDDPAMTDNVGQQVIVVEGDSVRGQDGANITTWRFVVEPDDLDLLSRRSTYWVDLNGRLMRVELADGLIQYIRTDAAPQDKP